MAETQSRAASDAGMLSCHRALMGGMSTWQWMRLDGGVAWPGLGVMIATVTISATGATRVASHAVLQHDPPAERLSTNTLTAIRYRALLPLRAPQHRHVSPHPRTPAYPSRAQSSARGTPRTSEATYRGSRRRRLGGGLPYGRGGMKRRLWEAVSSRWLEEKIVDWESV